MTLSDSAIKQISKIIQVHSQNIGYYLRRGRQ